jgi:hypothetical protein
MLNELCQLADALERAEISPKDWHPQFKLLPKVSEKKPCYRISITVDRTISSIDELSVELAPVLRKWEPSNGSSFPGFNIQPLYRITDEEAKKKIKSMKEGKEPISLEILKSWCTEENNNWDGKIAIKLSKCLYETPKNLVKFLDDPDVQGEGASLAMLIERVTRLPDDRSEGNLAEARFDTCFRKSLEEYLWHALEQDGSPKIVLPILM